MRKTYLLLFILCLFLPLTSQDIQKKSQVINIEIPVRVFLGTTFIDNLILADFEIYEEGILQDIEAVYLVKKRSTDILKKDITMGNSQYRSSLMELTGLALTLASDTERGSAEDLRIMDTSSSNQYSHYPFDRKLQKYASILERLESLRKVNQDKLLGFANYLKKWKAKNMSSSFTKGSIFPR